MKKNSILNKNIVIAVTGLNSGENPQPGIPVIRCIRNAGFEGKIVGLIYDSFESGIYADELADEVYQMPYPSEGTDAIFARIKYILTNTKIDILIPTLDSEILPYISLEERLKEQGIHMYLPTKEQFMLRDKTKLGELKEKFNILTPHTILLNDPKQAYEIPNKMPLPVMVKGRFYEAYKSHTIEEIIKHFNSIRAKWGLPIVIQEVIAGEEYNIAAIGDGEGNLIGAVPVKKTVVTEKGKGFASVVIDDPGLNKFASKIIKNIKWQGALEIEVLKSYKNHKYYLVEINPRLPAWIRLSAGAGQNLPYALARLAYGEKVKHMKKYKVGTLFIRHNEDIILDMSVIGKLASTGELRNLKAHPITQRIDKLFIKK